MLERIREGAQGTWATIILGLVALSFVFAGVGGYITSTVDEAAATVNGQDISVNTLEQAYQNERARMESQFGEAFASLAADPAYLQQMRSGLLDRLVNQTLLDQAAEALNMRVDGDQIKDAIRNMPEFQLGGVFSNDRYLAVIRQAGFQPDTFREYMRTEMTRQQLASALGQSEFGLAGEAARGYALQQQTRNGRYLTLSADAFADQVVVNDEDISLYYSENIESFDAEEEVKVSFVHLSVDDILPSISVTDDEIESFYQNNANSYRSEEERRASHILFEFGDDEDAAMAKAEAALARVNSGEDFAALATELSEDVISAELGGDLDWFGRDVMDPAFEEAAFALANVGDTTDVVTSEFGLHIIKLTDLREEQVIELAEVKNEVTEQVKRDKAITEFYNLQDRMAEVAFEAADQLEDVAETINGEVEQSDWLTRQTVEGVLASPAALAAVFSEDLIAERVNSDLISVSDEEVLVVKVDDYRPERTQSLDEVKDSIIDSLKNEKALDVARAKAQELAAAVASASDVTEQLAELTLEWQELTNAGRFAAGTPTAVSDALFSLSVNAREVVDVPPSQIALVELSGVNAADEADSNTLNSWQQNLANTGGQQNFTQLLEAMKATADIQVKN